MLRLLEKVHSDREAFRKLPLEQQYVVILNSVKRSPVDVYCILDDPTPKKPQHKSKDPHDSCTGGILLDSYPHIGGGGIIVDREPVYGQ